MDHKHQVQTIDELMLKNRNNPVKPKREKEAEKIDIEFSDESKAHTEVLEDVQEASDIDDLILAELNKVGSKSGNK